MPHWQDRHGPESQLPDGLRLIGYDADTGRRHYQDSTGVAWVGSPYAGSNDQPVRAVQERPTRIPSRPAAIATPIVQTSPEASEKSRPSLSSFLRPQKQQPPSVVEPVNHGVQPKPNGSRFSFISRRRRAEGSESSNYSYDGDSRRSSDNSSTAFPIFLPQTPTESPTQDQPSGPAFNVQGSQPFTHIEKGYSSSSATKNSPIHPAIFKDRLDQKPLPDLWAQKDTRDHPSPSEEVKDSARSPSEQLEPQTRQPSRFSSMTFYLGVLGINLTSILLVIFSSTPKH